MKVILNEETTSPIDSKIKNLRTKRENEQKMADNIRNQMNALEAKRKAIESGIDKIDSDIKAAESQKLNEKSKGSNIQKVNNVKNTTTSVKDNSYTSFTKSMGT